MAAIGAKCEQTQYWQRENSLEMRIGLDRSCKFVRLGFEFVGHS